MNYLPEDLLKNIYSYLYDINKKCLIDIEREERYDLSKLFLINKSYYKLLNFKCRIYFIYKPLNPKLPTICECNKHYNRRKNNIYIINQLNNMKMKFYARKTFLTEMKFYDKQDCEIALPYIKEYAKIAYISDEFNSIYLMNKYDRYMSFL